MGRECRTADVQHARRGVCGAADPHGDLRQLDRRHARALLPDPPRRVRAAERRLGPAAGRAAPLGGRLPPLPARCNARRAALRRGGIPHPEPFLRVGVFPLALHERRLRLARHDGRRGPHGVQRPAPRPRNGRGRPPRPGLRQSGLDAQLRGQHRRDGHPAERRRRR